MGQIEILDIRNFRGIASGKVDGMSPLTVLVGPNSCGKTTVLEALYFAASGGIPSVVSELATRRGHIGLEGLRAVFREGSRARVTYAGGGFRESELTGEEHQVLLFELRDRSFRGESKVQLTESGVGGGSHSGDFPHEDVEFLDVDTARKDPTRLERQVSVLEVQGKLEELIELSRPLNQTLRDFRNLMIGDRTTLYVVDELGRWPVISGGDGFKRLIMLATRLVHGNGNLSLIEEPESHQHPGSLGQVATLFHRAVDLGKQLVVTTHSLEYIDAQFLRATREQLEGMCIFRLSLRKGLLHAHRIAGTEVVSLREEIAEDLRR